MGTVTKCLGCDTAHSVLLTQAVDLVQQGTEDNLVIQDEDVEGIRVTLYMEKGLRGGGATAKEITSDLR